jgi:hypothetical protein
LWPFWALNYFALTIDVDELASERIATLAL